MADPEPDEPDGRHEPAAADAPPDGRGRSGARAVGLSSVLGLLLGGAAMVYVVRRLARDWPDASDALADADLAWVAVAVVTAVAAMTSIGWGWRHVLRLLGVRAPVGRVIAWYYVGELGKYVPGGVWPVLGRGELARRGGVPRTRAYASVALSLGLLYLAALFVSAGFLPFALSGGGFNVWMLFLLALPVGVVLLHHAVLERLLALIGRLTRRTIAFDVPRWKDSLALVARYVPTWILVGTATWAIARSLTPDASYPRVMFATVLSWTAGFLAVPVPAGAGIREAVLTASSGLDGGVAAATAIIARILFVLVDVAGAALSAPVAGRKRGGATVGPAPQQDEPVVIG
ncbi:MAG TPA: lysylphosphatidylglycerol synthase transmembrane domain-containing protein [Aquihabitans sp.]|nr:lysylphosphatidylglycerol synthase transmembrane domain-containing protein [Aquihabitans sp.]